MNQTILQKMMFWRRWTRRGSSTAEAVGATSSASARFTTTSTNQRKSTQTIGSLSATQDVKVDDSISLKHFPNYVHTIFGGIESSQTWYDREVEGKK